MTPAWIKPELDPINRSGESTIGRVLLCPLNADHPQRGIHKAFSSLIPEVHEYDFLALQRRGMSPEQVNAGLIEVAIRFRPDWVWLQVQNSQIILPDTIEHIRQHVPGCVITQWMGDCQDSVGPYSASICKVADLTLLSNQGQIPMYRSAGAPRVRYCQIAVDWEEDVLGLPPWEPPFRVPEVLFCGNYYGTTYPGTIDRVAAVRELYKAGVDVGVVGTGWPSSTPVVGRCGVKQQVHVWRRAKVGLSINNFNDIELYYSDRQLIAMASGTPVVCRYVPGLEREFSNGVDCLWYRDTDELVEQVCRLLRSEELRREMGRQGRARVFRNHTWWSRIFDVLPVVEDLRRELRSRMRPA